MSEKVTLEVRGYVMNSRALYKSQGTESLLSPKQNFRGFFEIGEKTEWQWFEAETEAEEWVKDKIKVIKNYGC